MDDCLKEINFGTWENLGISKSNFEIPDKNFILFYTDPFLLEKSYDVCRRTEEFYPDNH